MSYGLMASQTPQYIASLQGLFIKLIIKAKLMNFLGYLFFLNIYNYVHKREGRKIAEIYKCYKQRKVYLVVKVLQFTEQFVILLECVDGLPLLP